MYPLQLPDPDILNRGEPGMSLLDSMVVVGFFFHSIYRLGTKIPRNFPISFPSVESLMPGSRIILLYHDILKTTEMDLRRAERRGTESDSQSSATD